MIEIEYFPASVPPKERNAFAHPDWVSGIVSDASHLMYQITRLLCSTRFHMFKIDGELRWCAESVGYAKCPRGALHSDRPLTAHQGACCGVVRSYTCSVNLLHDLISHIIRRRHCRVGVARSNAVGLEGTCGVCFGYAAVGRHSHDMGCVVDRL